LFSSAILSSLSVNGLRIRAGNYRTHYLLFATNNGCEG
jgi:hypothetical protein